MTRFNITLDHAVKFVLNALKNMQGGEIFVPKIPSVKILDVLKAIDSDYKFEEIGIRPGEKIHEQMIGKEDALNTYEYKDFFKILNILESIDSWIKFTNLFSGI